MSRNLDTSLTEISCSSKLNDSRLSRASRKDRRKSQVTAATITIGEKRKSTPTHQDSYEVHQQAAIMNTSVSSLTNLDEPAKENAPKPKIVLSDREMELSAIKEEAEESISRPVKIAAIGVGL